MSGVDAVYSYAIKVVNLPGSLCLCAAATVSAHALLLIPSTYLMSSFWSLKALTVFIKKPPKASVLLGMVEIFKFSGLLMSLT